MAGLLLVFLVLAWLVAWQFDRGFGHRADDDLDDDELSSAEEVEQAEEIVTEQGPLDR